MNKTKIEWCDDSWNPVTGCFHECEYCYARRIAERFGLSFAPELGDPGMWGACKYDSEEAGMDTMLELENPYKVDGRIQPYPMGFKPTFHKYRLGEPARKTRPRTIFVCSMADLFGAWVPPQWIEQVFEACKAAPQHRYLFLTKNPYRYQQLLLTGKLVAGEHIWLGTTLTGKGKLPFEAMSSKQNFVSIEPLLEPMTGGKFPFTNVQWVIIGAETGNRKGKVTPEPAWIEDIVAECDAAGIPVFMKNSLVSIIGEENMRRDFPWGGESND